MISKLFAVVLLFATSSSLSETYAASDDSNFEKIATYNAPVARSSLGRGGYQGGWKMLSLNEDGVLKSLIPDLTTFREKFDITRIGKKVSDFNPFRATVDENGSILQSSSTDGLGDTANYGQGSKSSITDAHAPGKDISTKAEQGNKEQPDNLPIVDMESNKAHEKPDNVAAVDAENAKTSLVPEEAKP